MSKRPTHYLEDDDLIPPLKKKPIAENNILHRNNIEKFDNDDLFNENKLRNLQQKLLINNQDKRPKEQNPVWRFISENKTIIAIITIIIIILIIWLFIYSKGGENQELKVDSSIPPSTSYYGREYYEDTRGPSQPPSKISDNEGNSANDNLVNV